MKSYINKSLLILGLSSLITFGCGEEDITKLPVTALAEDEFWKSEDQVAQATNAAYFSLPGVGQVMWDALTEVMYSQSGSITQISTGSIGPGAGLVNSVWTGMYGTIRDANWFLENVEKAKSAADLTDADLAKYKGQMRFVRAYAHYQLLFHFGDVPLVERVLDINEGVVAPTARNTVRDWVLAELDQTITELSSNDYDPEFGRITEWAAKAFKARVLLYEGTLASDNAMLTNAANVAKDVIDNGGFSLHPTYTELFRPEGDRSSEVILARVYRDQEGSYHSLGQWLGPKSFHAAWNIISPTVALVETYPDINGEDISTSGLYDPNEPFDNRDPRLNQTIFDWRVDVDYEGASFVNEGTWYNFRKFIDPSEVSEQRSHNDYIIFRLAEMYLTYAEAMNEVNGPSQAGLDYINELRTRGGVGAGAGGTDIAVPAITLAGLTQADMRAIIQRERIIEMVGEGFLYYDYHRWGLLDETMNSPAVAVVPLENRTFTNPRDYEWPYPDFEVINNSLLIQKDGY